MSVKFLFEEIGVPGDKILPYNLQIVFLSEFFLLCPESSTQQIEQLKKWFWVTSYTGWFAGANSSKIKVGLEDVRNFARGTGSLLNEEDFNENATPLPDRFDFRYARVKVFVLFLLSLEPKGFDNDKDVFSDLGMEGYKALHPIFPENNRYGNKLLLGIEKYGYAKKILLENRSISHEVLMSHGITDVALNQLRNGNEVEFLNLREDHLAQMERIFMEEKGVAYSFSRESQTQISLFE